MSEQRDTQLLRLHRRRLGPWDLNEGPADVPIIRPTHYERRVIERAERVLDGRDHAIAHPHADKEMGVCEDCDTAAIVALWRTGEPSDGR